MDLINGLSYFISSLNKPKSFKDGEKFEKFNREILFPIELYKILSKTHDYVQNSKDYVESSLNPDYEFQPYDSKWSFFVECKFRNITENNDKIYDILDEQHLLDKALTKEEQRQVDQLIKPYSYIQLCDDNQLLRYKELNQKKDVFISLGLLDENEDDIKIFMIPIGDLLINAMHMNVLDNYVVANNHHVTPPILYGLAHDSEGHCIRCNKSIDSGTFCFDCWKSWFKYKNFHFDEKYCNECGKEFNTTAAKPICIECYRNQPF
jgi:hypothetical protein